MSYDEFYSRDIVDIEKFSIIEISQALRIPKESARRKVSELEKLGAIKKKKKILTIDRSKFYYSKPIHSIKRVCRFLSALSEICKNEKILSRKITSEELELVVKDNFSYVWKLYYEIQIPMLISYKKIFQDLENFHIYGICVLNEHLHARKKSIDYMHRDDFLKSFFSDKKSQGVNAMSISDITGIPRATVIRKLKKLTEQKILIIDAKKHYRLSGSFTKKINSTQREVFLRLTDFSTKVFNLLLLSKK